MASPGGARQVHVQVTVEARLVLCDFMHFISSQRLTTFHPDGGGGDCGGRGGGGAPSGFGFVIIFKKRGWKSFCCDVNLLISKFFH